MPLEFPMLKTASLLKTEHCDRRISREKRAKRDRRARSATSNAKRESKNIHSSRSFTAFCALPLFFRLKLLTSDFKFPSVNESITNGPACL